MKLPLNIKAIPSILILFSFAIPTCILFFLDQSSFYETWKGRTFYLFFLWLIILRLYLSWKELQFPIFDSLKSVRGLCLMVASIAPTLYVAIAYFSGLNSAILNVSSQFNVPMVAWMPLSVEYLIFTALLIVIVMLAYGFEGLNNFSISTFFLGAIGTVYMIDNFYPYGRFTPFQAFVPATASSAGQILNWMGYQTTLTPNVYEGMPYLALFDSSGYTLLWGAYIGWPCSGVQSLLIYTFTMLLFFKKTTIPPIHRLAYFVIGAVCTYIVNILRIVSIFLIAVNQGPTAASTFHNYYGELYAITWILAYPLIIIGSRMLWAKVKPEFGVGKAVQRLFR
ncbi:MAG: archaeosortase/exosortase family protein [Candidatus Bathyarchaeota archaeon]|nr:MAG: archaeosortase/exosortase family protein [Candidatus Bathyarchaeota archaeon]